MVEYCFDELNNTFDTKFQAAYTLTAYSWAICKRSNSETENFLAHVLGQEIHVGTRADRYYS